MPARVTHLVIRTLDRFFRIGTANAETPRHLRTGRRGEEDAFFYLADRGYTVVGRNFRSRRRRGEIDLIAWQGNTLCFIEVKTRTTLDVKPAEAAVDARKQHELAAMAQEYLRHVTGVPAYRFDVVSVFYPAPEARPQIVLFNNAFAVR
jgi:putative endonuclease